MITHENSFQAFMSKMFSDIAAFDESTVQKLQNIFTEYSNFKISQYGNLTGHFNNLLPFVNNIQSAGPFRDFDRRYQITTNDIWQKKRTLENFSYKISPHTVVKEGPLYRTAEIRSSHWKPVWALLTDTGYLHCFKMDMEKKVIRDYTIKRQGTGSNIVEEGQKAYNDLKKPETYFSLKIGNNIKCVETTKKKAPKYTFDIVLDTSTKSRGPGDYKGAAEEIKKRKSIFGGSKKQDSTVVFTLRADTQEIYNAWVDKINAVAETAPSSDGVVSIAAAPSILSSAPSVLSSTGSVISAGSSVRGTPSASPAPVKKAAPAPADKPADKPAPAPAPADKPAPAPAAPAAAPQLPLDIGQINLYESLPETPSEVPAKDEKPAIEKVESKTETATEAATEKASEAAKEQEKVAEYV